VRDLRKRPDREAFAGVDDVLPDTAMQLLNRLEERMRGSHASFER
jgi:hypothetical protein